MTRFSASNACPAVPSRGSQPRHRFPLLPAMRRRGLRGSYPFIALIVAALQVVAPLGSRAASSTASEKFTFSERAPSVSAATPSGNVGTDKHLSPPVSSDGAFGTSIAIQVPPGRLGLTPELALSYASGARTKDSPVGVGWSLGLPTISRSTRAGFPAVAWDDGPCKSVYADPDPSRAIATDTAWFDGPAGPLVRTNDGPRGEPGIFFAPLREDSAVRYAYDRGQGGAWIEYLPDGRRRYYGFDKTARTGARVMNELGTHEWFLQKERDLFGNLIEYTYNPIEDEYDPDRPLEAAMHVPVLKGIAWGGNDLQRLPHRFFVETLREPYAGAVDMLAGHTMLGQRVTAFVIKYGAPGAAPVEWWRYTLTYDTSPDTKRHRLWRVTRVAPGETSRTWTLGYSGNAGTVRFGAAVTLPPTQGYKEGVRVAGSPDPDGFTEKGARSPRFRRSASKFTDLDGDGRLDILYHPAGMTAPESQAYPDFTYLRRAGAPSAAASWTQLPQLDNAGSPTKGSNGIDFSRPWKELVDLDGDRDQDAISFEFVTVPAFGIPEDSPAGDSDMTLYCCGRFGADCGAVDPVPPGYESQMACMEATYAGDLTTQGVTPGMVESYGAAYEAGGGTYRSEQTCRADSDDAPGGAPIGGNGPGSGAPGRPTGVPPRGPFERHMCTGDTMALCNSIASTGACGNPAPTIPELDQWTVVSAPTECHHPLAYAGLHSQTGAMFYHVHKNVGDGRILSGQEMVDQERSLAEWPDYVTQEASVTRDASGVWSASTINDFLAPMVDLNADGRADLVLLKTQSGTRSDFRPRAYISTSATGGFRLDSKIEDGNLFTASLLLALRMPTKTELSGLLRPDVDIPCLGWECMGTLRYPSGINWNSMLQDVNGDGLPDLIVARYPRAWNGDPDDGRVCGAGHRVFLNRGYRFDGWEDNTFDDTWLGWSSKVDDELAVLVTQLQLGNLVDNPNWARELYPEAHPFLLLANHEGTCGGELDEHPWLAEHKPLGSRAMAMTDLNGDGLADIVFAYAWEGQTHRYVYMNGTRGYRKFELDAGAAAAVSLAGTAVQWPTHPESGLPVELAVLDPVKQGLARVDTSLPDTARFADIDGDGFDDLVRPGACGVIDADPGRPGVQYNCGVATKYFPRLGSSGTTAPVLPDLLTSVTRETTAATTIVYVPANKHAATPTVNGKLPPVGSWVVSQIKEKAGTGLPERINTLTYADFTANVAGADPIGRLMAENLGFAQITSVVRNPLPQGGESGALTTTWTFDTRENIAGVGVRFPLKGRAWREVVSGSNWTTTTTETFQVLALGASARIRPAATQVEDCFAGNCRSVRSEWSNYDAYGFAQTTKHGNGTAALVNDAELVETRKTYLHYSDWRWHLGMTTRHSVIGDTLTIDGAALADRTLSEQTQRYDDSGRVVETRQRDVSSAYCQSQGSRADSVSTYGYDLTGLLAQTASAGRSDYRTYDIAYPLYPTARGVFYDRYVGGLLQRDRGQLEERFVHDWRTGVVTSRTDFNGIVWADTYDSQGRLLTARGNNSLLRSIAYTDAANPNVATHTIYTDGATRYTRKEYKNGWGEVLATYESAGSAYYRRSFVKRDSRGNVTLSYLPAAVANTNYVAPAAGSAVATTTYDAHSRATRLVAADGAVSTMTYAPRVRVATNPRGYVTETWTGSDGRLLDVVHRDPAGVVAQETYRYDGTGALIAAEDGDDNARHVVRDGAGRATVVTLPHRAGTAPSAFEICYDDHGPSFIVSPEARTLFQTHDGLGRIVLERAVRGEEGTADELFTYDDAATRGKGRLSSVSDALGVTTYTYDVMGYADLVAYSPAQTVKTLLGPAVTNRYTMDYNVATGGVLKQVQLSGLGTQAAAKLARYVFTNDAFGRPTDVTSSDGVTSLTLARGGTYDAADRLTALTFGNGVGGVGVAGAYAYHATSQRLERITFTRPDTQVLSRLDYRWDPNGNLEAETRTQLGVLVSSKAHHYDAMDRLMDSGTEVFPIRQSRAEALTYSASGNIETAGGAAYTYGLDANPQAVTSVNDPASARTLAYDLDGILTRDVRARGGLVTTTDLDHDALGCLVSATLFEKNGAVTTKDLEAEYLCGQGGKRMVRVVENHLTNTRSGVLQVGGLAEVRADEGIVLLRVPVGGTTVVEEARLTTSGARVANLSGFLHKDARGSVLMRTAWGDQTVLSEAEYDAWGQPLDVSATPRPKHGFLDSEPDPGLGFHTFGPRTYDPTLRRWLSPDPLYLAMPGRDAGDGQQMNLYAYARNNPTTVVDLSGLEGEKKEPAEEKAKEDELAKARAALAKAQAEAEQAKKEAEQAKKEAADAKAASPASPDDAKLNPLETKLIEAKVGPAEVSLTSKGEGAFSLEMEAGNTSKSLDFSVDPELYTTAQAMGATEAAALGGVIGGRNPAFGGAVAAIPWMSAMYGIGFVKSMERDHPGCGATDSCPNRGMGHR